MNLDQQVCNFELSEKLAKLGVPQESAFYWVETYPHKKDFYLTFGYGSILGNEKHHSAFTVAEIGVMLPKDAESSKTFGEGWACDYPQREEGKKKSKWVSFTEDTEADARAKCLIYLIESGIVKV